MQTKMAHPRLFVTLACMAAAMAVLWLTALPAHAALQIQTWETARGARVYFVQSRDLPILDVSVEFPAGSSRDTPRSSGLASLTLRTMRMGAQGMSEDELSMRLADVGANLGTTFDFDRAGYSLRTLSSATERREALDVLARLLQQPAFPEDVLEREKARVSAGLREGEVKPEVIASRLFAQLVYREHPYGLRATGELESLAHLSRGDVAAFHARYYAAAHAVVAMIGDIDRHEAERIAEQLTAGLPNAGDPLPPLPPVASLPQPALRVVEHPALQAHIFMGAPGIRRSDPDYFPLMVGNYILGGGGFNSRFTEEVREKRGLSYSVYSVLAPYEQLGAFTIGLQTRKDQADEALRVVRETLAAFVSDGPTERELEGARQNMIGGFALRIDSNRKILDYLAVIGFYRLPLDWLEQYPQRVAEVTPAQIRDAFQRRIDPTRMATVVVGRPVTSADPPAQ
jgi:zinc protease